VAPSYARTKRRIILRNVRIITVTCTELVIALKAVHSFQQKSGSIKQDYEICTQHVL
jgi:hypothetical protein